MEKLSIEEKAKAYDEALERAKKVFNCGANDREPGTSICEYIFPVLKESEDEKIRKFLIKWIQDNYYHGTTEIPTKTLIDWLEKQKTIDVLDKEEKEFADNVDSYRKDMDEFYKKGYNAGREAEKQYWLEKQRKQKLPIENLPSEMKTIEESLGFTTQEECDKYNQMVSELIMSDDKNKPKFKVGDWVVSPNGVYWHIDAIQNGRYEVTADTGQCGNWPLDTNIYRLWTIQDAKDGDVLSNGKMIVIFKHFEEPSYRQHIVAYIGLDIIGNIQITDDTWNLGIDKTKPATKEQRDLLFQKIKEVGYEWDAEKKELEKQGEQKPTIEMKSAEESLGIDSETYNKIVDECIYGEQKPQRMVSAEAKEALYDKPACAWSEEDEKRIKDIIYFLDTAKKHYASTVELDACIDWLKSLKERIGGE